MSEQAADTVEVDQVADTVTVDQEPVSSENYKDHFSKRVEPEVKPAERSSLEELLNSFGIVADNIKLEEREPKKMYTDTSRHAYQMVIKVDYEHKYSKRYNRDRVTICRIWYGDKMLGYGRVCWYPEDEFDKALGNRNAFLKALKAIEPKQFIHMLSEAYFAGSTVSKKKK